MEAVNTGRIEMARVSPARRRSQRQCVHGGLADICGVPRVAACECARPGMIDLMAEHEGWIDAGSVGICATRTSRAACSRASSTRISRPALGSDGRRTDPVERREWPRLGDRAHGARRIDWPRDDPRWFWMLWRRCPGIGPNDAEEADCRESFRLILEQSDPNLSNSESNRRCCTK